jgi:hypothetical protein
MEGLGAGHRLAKETPISIGVYDVKGRTKALMNFAGLIPIPLQVATPPVELPFLPTSEEANPSNWNVTR